MAFYIARFKNMETREFEVEVVTPLFLGGANPKKAELRAASIKGALRFWWRALYGCDEMENMKKRESEIFGSTEKKANMLLRLGDTSNVKYVLENLPQGLKVPVQSKRGNFQVSIIEYLAFGLCEYKKNQRKNIYTKEHIPAGNKFNISLLYNKTFAEQILNSFKALVNYGGLGSHSRNGFGSIWVKDLSLKFKNEGELKSFTSFSSQAKFFNNFNQKENWADALSVIGKAYKEARNRLENKHSFIKRQLIAKPIIVKNEVNINDRHAKPYFLHVNKLSNSKYQGQILFLPYNYDQTKREEYFETCKKMNDMLSNLSGGSK